MIYAELPRLTAEELEEHQKTIHPYILRLTAEKLGIWSDVMQKNSQAENEIVKKSEAIQKDNVNQPNHYTVGGIEVIDYIRAKLTTPQLKGYYVGNLLKYISRAEHKNGVEDLKKAEVYLKWLIELTEKQGMSMED